MMTKSLSFLTTKNTTRRRCAVSVSTHPLTTRPQANSAFHPSGVGKWVPALAVKAKAGMVHSVSGWTRGVQVKLWDPLRTRAIPDRLRGVFTTRRCTNRRLPLPFLYYKNSLLLYMTRTKFHLLIHRKCVWWRHAGRAPTVPVRRHCQPAMTSS